MCVSTQGRAQEVPGECPYLTGEYGVQIVAGTQRGPADGDGPIDPRYLYAAVTMKHFQGSVFIAGLLES